MHMIPSRLYRCISLYMRVSLYTRVSLYVRLALYTCIPRCNPGSLLPIRLSHVCPRERGALGRQNGATLAEFLIIAPLVMLIGMATVQASLIYHGKTTLNYATFEAARSGAVHNAQLSSMRSELGLRLAPLQAGDGTAQAAARAIALASVAVEDTTNTHIRVLNPTTAAFEDWGMQSQEYGRRVLPNSHLRHREHTIGQRSGLSLRDANLLKIEVTHGMQLKVPFVNTLISRGMMLVDPENAIYYLRNRFPLKSVATVRMQSEAFEDEIILAALSPPAEDSEGADGVSTSVVEAPGLGPDDDSDADSDVESQGESEGVEAEGSSISDCEQGEYGLGMSPVMLETSDYEQGECPAVSPTSAGLPGGAGECG